MRRPELAPAMSNPALILRRAKVRKRGELQLDDYDVFDGDYEVGRIYLVHAENRAETWFWNISFQITKRKSYGYASSLQAAKAASQEEYDRWRRRQAEKPTLSSGSD